MKPNAAKPIAQVTPDEGYRLEQQVGYILRQALAAPCSRSSPRAFRSSSPRRSSRPRWRLLEVGPCSQNQLGRLTAMDAATIKGVTDRLIQRGFVEANARSGRWTAAHARR